jgi:hypothetical protein
VARIQPAAVIAVRTKGRMLAATISLAALVFVGCMGGSVDPAESGACPSSEDFGNNAIPLRWTDVTLPSDWSHRLSRGPLSLYLTASNPERSLRLEVYEADTLGVGGSEFGIEGLLAGDQTAVDIGCRSTDATSVTSDERRGYRIRWRTPTGQIEVLGLRTPDASDDDLRRTLAMVVVDPIARLDEPPRESSTPGSR